MGGSVGGGLFFAAFFSRGYFWRAFLLAEGSVGGGFFAADFFSGVLFAGVCGSAVFGSDFLFRFFAEIVVVWFRSRIRLFSAKIDLGLVRRLRSGPP